MKPTKIGIITASYLKRSVAGSCVAWQIFKFVLKVLKVGAIFLLNFYEANYELNVIA